MNAVSTNDVLSYLKELGADFAGISSLKPLLTDNRYKKISEEICPDGNSVIVFGTNFPQSILDGCPGNNRPARYTLNALYSEGANMCLKVSRMLERNGFKGVIIPAYLPVEMSYETMGLKGDLNLKHAAVEAGLGWRGKSDLLITPEFGPRVRLFGIITNAELKPTSKNIQNLCLNCRECIDSCPSGAISESGCNPKRCSAFSMKNGLPRILKFMKSIEKKETKEEKFKKLRSLEFWNYWQALSQGSFYECFMCLKSCPVGKIDF